MRKEIIYNLILFVGFIIASIAWVLVIIYTFIWYKQL